MRHDAVPQERSGFPAAVIDPPDSLQPDELLPGLWRLPLPLRDSALGHVNAYLIQADDGCVLVDCGWDTPDCLRALEQHLRVVGIRFRDIQHLLVTHIHPDHYGLAGRLREITNADLRLHRLERLYVESRYADANELLREMHEWLRLNGAPGDDLDSLNRASTSMLERVETAFPDFTLDGGEELEIGAYTFRVLWTPGHSAGHICLYEPVQQVLLSGDHVLPLGHSAISLHVQSGGNPLADYLDSLRQLSELDVDLVLPGHGEPFVGLRGRIRQILAYQQQRLAHIRAVLRPDQRQPRTAYEVARELPRDDDRAWSDLRSFERRATFTETLAHLELLHARGEVAKRFGRGQVGYVLRDEG